MRRLFLIGCWLVAICLSTAAQSNLTYELTIGTAGPVALVDTFPSSYASEKVNIQVESQEWKVESQEWKEESQEYDYVFVAPGAMPTGQGFDSVYCYTDNEGHAWSVWRNNTEIKNRTRRVLVHNAREVFLSYILLHTQQPARSIAWLGWIAASLLLMAGLVYIVLTIRHRSREKRLPTVEQERLRRQRNDNRRHWGSQLYLWIVLLVLYAPIALIAVFSFTESKVLGNWTGFSFDLYLNLFSGHTDSGLHSALGYTLGIALIAAVCSTILGTLAAIGIYNMRARQRKVVSLLNSVPMINPDIITGISLFLLFVALGISQGMATVCIAHVVFCTPYVVLNVLPRLSRMNPNTYEAALDLGATPLQALRMVMLPELWPGMLAGFFLALTLSVDDFGVTFFTKGSGGLDTLSTFIYSDARKGGLTPELRPLFTIILLIMLGVLIYINMKDKKKEQK